MISPQYSNHEGRLRLNFYDRESEWWGDKNVDNGFLTNGWSNSSTAVGRLSGFTCKHLRIKSWASFDKELGMCGG